MTLTREFVAEEQRTYDSRWMVENVLMIKDKICLSDESYEILRNLQPELPTIDLIKFARNESNKKILKKSVTGGVYTPILRRLKKVIKAQFDYLEDYIQLNNDKLSIKFCADAAAIGRGINIMNIMFSFPHDEKFSMGVNGHFLIGNIEMQAENYQTYRLSLGSIFEEIYRIDGMQIIVKGKTIKLEALLTGDMEFLDKILAIKPPNSDNPCLWCTCPKNRFHKFNEWVAGLRGQQYVRSIEHARINIGNFGYVSIPLTSLAFTKTTVDVLHMFLRISDRLEECFVNDIEPIDFQIHGIRGGDIDRRPVLKRFSTFLDIECNIKNYLYFENPNWKSKNLTGLQKLRLFESLKRSDFLILNQILSLDDTPVTPEKRNLVPFLWKNFYSIYSRLAENDINPQTLREETSEWLRIFLICYKAKKITPYIHIFCVHLHEQLERIPHLYKFNLQGLEKYHSFCKRYFHQATNRHFGLRMSQILEKRIRNENYFMKNREFYEEQCDRKLRGRERRRAVLEIIEAYP